MGGQAPSSKIEKSSILPFGEHDHDRQQIAYMGWSWNTGPLKILGVKLTNRFDGHLNLNYKPKIDIIKEHMSAWSNRIMTPMFRVVIVKTFIIYQLVYLLSNLPSPSKDFLSKIDKMIFNFIWNGKFGKIKRKYLRLDKDQGGLNVPHLGTQDKVLKISWLHKLLNRQDNDVLSVMVNNMFFGKLKYILTCNLQYKDCYIFQNLTSDFWQDVIKSWCTYNYVIPREWRLILHLEFSPVLCNHTYNISRMVTMKKNNFMLYNRLRSDVIEEPFKLVTKWKQDGFSIELDMLYNAFQMIYSNAISVKLRMFQFKLLHRKLALNPFLLKIGIKRSDKCSFVDWKRKQNYTFFANVG